ncbi:MAG: hypothetical protein D6811_04330 [Alphaproteobacteria bacterium]|nr:MAG: hypothetical protein D6811_04330 [Alphaproteobacteria bacterium]
MSETDTEAGAAGTAAPEDVNEDQVWEEALRARRSQASSEDEDDHGDDAASDDGDAGTDEATEAEASEGTSEPEEAAPDEGKSAGDGEKPEKPKPVDIGRLKGTIAGQNRKIAELQREIAEWQKRAQKRGADIQSLDDLKSEYPDIVGPLAERLERLEAELGAQHELLSKVSSLTEAQQQEQLLSEARRLDQMVPDWEATIAKNRAEFDAWVNDPETPQWVVRVYEANQSAVTDADAVAQLVSAFKSRLGGDARPQEPAPKGATKKPASRRLEGARATMSRGTTVTEDTVAGLSPEEIWKREARKRARERARMT